MKESSIRSQDADRNTQPLKRLLLARGCALPSDPINGLAKEFRDQGIDVLLAGESFSTDPARWMMLAWRSQAIVFIRYKNADGRFIRSQLYRAKLFGRPVIRWWVGTDVLNSLASEEARKAARFIDQAVDLNIAVSPHLVSELQEIGIKAEYVPSLSDLKNIEHPPAPDLPKGVLAYLPTKRRTFYGENVVIAAIEANPDLPFFIVGDESHSLAHYPNVTSLGWVDDLNDVWAQTGLLLRVTEHDGMPRMVLDALARARYVVYSQHFEGCWYARSEAEALAHLNSFRSLQTLNRIGPKVTATYSATAGTTYTDHVTQLVRNPWSAERLRTIIDSLSKLPALLPSRLKPFSSARAGHK